MCRQDAGDTKLGPDRIDNFGAEVFDVNKKTLDPGDIVDRYNDHFLDP